MKNVPGFPSTPCAGRNRSLPELEAALEAVGRSARLAAKLRERIDHLTSAGRPPIAPNRPGFNEGAWQVLAAYLIEERRLIEFLLGPVVRKGKTHLRYAYSNDICVDCFATQDGQPWRFLHDGVRKKLDGRAGRINIRLAHFAWTLAAPDMRLDLGAWNTEYLEDIVQGLRQFSDWLEATNRNTLAEVLRQSMGTEQPLPPDGAPAQRPDQEQAT